MMTLKPVVDVVLFFILPALNCPNGPPMGLMAQLPLKGTHQPHWQKCLCKDMASSQQPGLSLPRHPPPSFPPKPGGPTVAVPAASVHSEHKPLQPRGPFPSDAVGTLRLAMVWRPGGSTALAAASIQPRPASSSSMPLRLTVASGAPQGHHQDCAHIWAP